MVLSEIISGIRHSLDEYDVDNSHWDNARLTVFINEGVGETATLLPHELVPDLLFTELKDIGNGSQNYTIESDYLSLDYVIVTLGDENGEDFTHQAPVFTPAMYNALQDNETHEPSVTTPYIIRWGHSLQLWPVPVVSVSQGMVLYLRRHPAKLTEEDDEPELPENTHSWVVQYACYRALTEDENYELADKFWRQFSGHFATEEKK